MKALVRICPSISIPFLLIVSWVLCTSESVAIDYYSAENVRRFADHLFKQEDFGRAAGEYDRLRFILGDSGGRDSALFLSGLSFMKGNEFDRAKQRLEQLFTLMPSSPLREESVYCFARATYFQGDLLQVADFLQGTGYSTRGQAFSNHTLELLTITYVRMGQWEMAREISCNMRPDGHSENRTPLCSLVLDGMNLQFKHKSKAAVLSAVVPGMGKLYTGRSMDAAFAFILIGSTAWQSYRGFQRSGRNSSQGWIFGILAGALHLGNVYGAMVSVEIYNRNMRNRYYAGFESKIGLEVP